MGVDGDCPTIQMLESEPMKFKVMIQKIFKFESCCQKRLRLIESIRMIPKL